MATEKQFEANRENSKLSTGPITAEGKAISSQNAVKHGMCCKVHVPQHEAGDFNIRLNSWLGDVAPNGSSILKDLVVLGVRNYHRVDRILRAEDAEAARRVRDSGGIWDRERNERLQVMIKELDSNAPVAVKSLETTVAGCNWMLDTWEGLFHAMDKQLWKPPYHQKSRQLLGYDSTDPERDVRKPDQWNFLMNQYLVLLAEEGKPWIFMPWQEQLLTVQGLIDGNARDHRILWERRALAIPACESYEALMQSEMTRIRGIRDGLLPLEEADREGAKERALADTSPQGKLMARYVSESQRDLFRTLKEIREMAKAEAKNFPPLARNEANLVEPDPIKHE